MIAADNSEFKAKSLSEVDKWVLIKVLTDADGDNAASAYADTEDSSAALPS